MCLQRWADIVLAMDLVLKKLLLAPAVTVGETEGAMDSAFFCLFFCL